MTSTFSQIWNTNGLAVDIATDWYSRGSGFHFSTMERLHLGHFSLRIRAEFWKECVLIMLYCASNNVFLSLSLLSLSLSLSLTHSFRLAVMPGCRVETLRQSNAREIKDNFQNYIRITTRFFLFRIFQPKIKMDSRRFPLSFIYYTNCIKWLSGIDGFSLSSTACRRFLSF
jgi:hypothetical protein